jgi:hypothetical protein
MSRLVKGKRRTRAAESNDDNYGERMRQALKRRQSKKHTVKKKAKRK